MSKPLPFDKRSGFLERRFEDEVNLAQEEAFSFLTGGMVYAAKILSYYDYTVYDGKEEKLIEYQMVESIFAIEISKGLAIAFKLNPN